jgi:hypothetical protein
MRLLRDEGLGKLSLVEYPDEKIPRYAILTVTPTKMQRRALELKEKVLGPELISHDIRHIH